MEELEFHAMGCEMFVAVDVDGPGARAALAEVPRWFETWEQSLSRFRENSELSALNRKPGRAVHVSETLWQVTRLSLRAGAQSEGLITPTILDALEAAGYDRSMSGPGSGAAIGVNIGAYMSEDLSAGGGLRLHGVSTPHIPGSLSQPLRGVQDWRAVRMDPRRRTITLPRGVRIDVAGVAKGWAADQAARRLGRFAPALVNASGDIAVSGPRADGSAWANTIENPFGSVEDTPLMLLAYEGEATSSRGYRRWLHGGKWQHHIIDPRTGAPAETDVFSATAIAPTAAEAEVAAKVAFILGSRAGIEWIDARQHLAAFLILENGRHVSSARFHQYIWE
jgi:FAD:protein FMN transferase